MLLALLLGLQVPARAADFKAPHIGTARMVDDDADGFADTLTLRYSEKITHKADDDGVYPFRVEGYKILRIGRAHLTKSLTIHLKEKAKTDPGAKPNVLYDRGRHERVYDVAGNQAATQTFKDTASFVSVPNGSALLIVNVEGPGNVTTQDGTFTCAASCYEVVAENLVPVVLNAEPDDGAAFTGWSGDCEGTSTSCLLPVDGDKTVGAVFSTS